MTVAVAAETCYLAVLRALELAANRNRNTGRKTREALDGIPAYMTHVHRPLTTDRAQCPRLFAGAFALLRDTLTAAGYPADTVTESADVAEAYAAELVVEQRPPDLAELSRRLDHAPRH